MKSKLITLIFLVAIIGTSRAHAQETASAQPDSLHKEITLDNLIVKETRRQLKGDTILVMPTSAQRRAARTGYELIRLLQLPTLRVNTIEGSISTMDGGSVIVLVDGRPVEKQTLTALQPKDVASVAFVQNPGAEYGYDENIVAVIEIVMKERVNGYSAGFMGANAVTTLNGENMVYYKNTHKNSEFNVSLMSSYTSLTKRRINEDDNYLIGDDWTKIEKRGINTQLRFSQTSLQLGYNYFLPRSQHFDVTFEGVFYHSPKRGHKQFVTGGGLQDSYQLTSPYEKNIMPTLNIYYKKYFSGASALTANIVGTYKHTDYRYLMEESLQSDMSSPFSSYSYSTSGKRSSAIGEVRYFKKFSQAIGINTGVRGSYAHTVNDYTGNNDLTDRFHDTNIYGFIAAYGYLFNNKLYYYGGMGVTGRLLSQNGNHSSQWLCRPEFRLTYSLANWRFRLDGVLSQVAPSTGDLTDAEVMLNSYELRRGNPDLNDWWRYRMNFNVNGSIGPIGVQNRLSFTTQHRPVMGEILRGNANDNSIFISTLANQKRFNAWSETLTLFAQLFNGFSVSAGAQFNAYYSRGNHYSHNLNTWKFDFSADWIYRNWSIGLSWNSNEKSLFGETITRHGAYNNLYVNYSIGNVRLGLIGQYLFLHNGPSFGESLRSDIMVKNQELIVPAQGNMIMLSIAWNISKGKQRSEAKKDLDNSDNESTMMKYQ